jgi:hypothetical protein
MHTANGLRHAEPLDRPPTWDQSTVCRGLYSAVSFYRISPCALFCRESVSKYTVRPIFAVCIWFIRREPLFCRALRYMAHSIIVNAVRRPTANAPHTEKEDFPVVNGPNIVDIDYINQQTKHQVYTEIYSHQ